MKTENKQFTSYEIAQELTKIGVSTDTADMHYRYDIGFLNQYKPVLFDYKHVADVRERFSKCFVLDSKPIKPCWSLAGLLDVLPKNLKDKEGTIRVREIIGDDVSYAGLGMIWNSQPTLLLNVVDAIKTLIAEGYSLKDATLNPSESMIQLPESVNEVQNLVPKFTKYFPFPWKEHPNMNPAGWECDYIDAANGVPIFGYEENSKEKYHRILDLLNGEEREKFERVIPSNDMDFILATDQFGVGPLFTLHFIQYFRLIDCEGFGLSTEEALEIKKELITYCIEKLRK